MKSRLPRALVTPETRGPYLPGKRPIAKIWSCYQNTCRLTLTARFTFDGHLTSTIIIPSLTPAAGTRIKLVSVISTARKA